MTKAAQKQTQADKPVANDHDRRKYRLARFRRIVGAMRDHRRHRGDLNNCHGDGQQQSAIGFAQPYADDLSMIERRKHHADQQHRRKRGNRERRAGRRRLKQRGAKEENARHDRRQRGKNYRAAPLPKTLAHDRRLLSGTILSLSIT